MWAYVLNKPKQGNYFIYFMVDLVNVGINCCDYIDKVNTSNQIAVVEAKYYKVSNPETKNLSYIESFRTGIVEKK